MFRLQHYVNASKSECIHFSPRGHIRKRRGGIPIFPVCRNPIEIVKTSSGLILVISFISRDMGDFAMFIKYYCKGSS